MMKEASINGKNSRRRVRKLPKQAIPSTFNKAPKNLPINFYNPKWFNGLQSGQKRLVANCEAVAFLPNAAQSLLPIRHPDEKIGDNAFNGKYLDILKEAYDMSDEEENGFDEGEEESDGDTSIDLEAESDGAEDEEEEDSDVYDEGDYGDLYEDKSESDEAEEDATDAGTKKGKEKAIKQDEDEDKDEDEDDDEDDGDFMGEE